MKKILLPPAAILLTAATSYAVTVPATDFPRNNGSSIFTTSDSLVTFSTTNTFSGNANFFGDIGPGATANLVNAYNGAERLTVDLEEGVTLTGFGTTFSADTVTISGFTGDPGLLGANAGTTTFDSQTNEVTFRLGGINGNVRELTLSNPEVTEGQTLVFRFAGTQTTFTSFSYEPSTEPAPTPTASYSFDESTITGTVVEDTSGNGLDGTLVPSADAPIAGADGIFAQALQFLSGDSPEGILEVPAAAVPSGSSPRTFSLWFNAAGLDANSQNKLFGYGANSPGAGFEIGLEGSGIRLRHYGGNITYGAGFDFVGADAGWHHLAVRVNEGATTFADVDVFLDGSRLVIGNTAGGGIGQTLNTTSSNLGLAGTTVAPNPFDFAGSLDEFAVWDSALIIPQISTLAEPPPVPDIVSFRALPQNRVPVGTVVPLEWDVTDATSLILTPSNGEAIDVTGTTTLDVTVTELVSYTLTATNDNDVTVSEELSLAVGDTPYPNVVVFFLDDFGWSDWEQNGAPEGSLFYETPAMNQLAAEGIYFDHGYASAPVCSPTRAALLTGTAPALNKLTDFIPGNPPADFARVERAIWTPRLDLSAANFANTFSDNGYRAIHVGKWHLGEGAEPATNPLNAGFDVNIGGNNFGTPPFPERFFAGPNGFSSLPALGADVAPQGSYLTDVLTEQATEQIRDAAADDTAFILYLSHYAVHVPIQAPEPTVQKFRDKLATRPIEEWEGHTNPTYAAMIEHVDRSLAQIIATLEDPDGDPTTDDSIAENTLVILTSDNGGLETATSNRPLRNGKGGNYEGGIREPWIFWRPGTIEPAVISEPIVSHDLFPTLLTHVGITPPANADFSGQDLTPLLTGEDFEREEPMVFHYPHWSPKDQTGSPFTAIRRGDYKLIYNYDNDTWELYNVITNPEEDINLIASEPDRHQVLSWLMSERLQDLGANFPRELLSRNGDRDIVTGADRPLIPLLFGDQDDDNDGKSNLDEVIEGTDPESASSFFQVSPQTTGSNIGLSFVGLRGRAFDLEASTTLAPNSWEVIESITPLEADTQIIIDNLQTEESQRFFRIRTSFP